MSTQQEARARRPLLRALATTVACAALGWLVSLVLAKPAHAADDSPARTAAEQLGEAPERAVGRLVDRVTTTAARAEQIVAPRAGTPPPAAPQPAPRQPAPAEAVRPAPTQSDSGTAAPRKPTPRQFAPQPVAPRGSGAAPRPDEPRAAAPRAAKSLEQGVRPRERTERLKESVERATVPVELTTAVLREQTDSLLHRLPEVVATVDDLGRTVLGGAAEELRRTRVLDEAGRLLTGLLRPGAITDAVDQVAEDVTGGTEPVPPTVRTDDAPIDTGPGPAGRPRQTDDAAQGRAAPCTEECSLTASATTSDPLDTRWEAPAPGARDVAVASQEGPGDAPVGPSPADVSAGASASPVVPGSGTAATSTDPLRWLALPEADDILERHRLGPAQRAATPGATPD